MNAARSDTALQLQPVVMFSGTSDGLHTKGGEAAYSQYIRHLEKTSPAVKAMRTEGTVEHFAQGYQDYLQAPLQVCSVNYNISYDLTLSASH